LLGRVGAVFVAGHGIDAATVVVVDEAGAGGGFGAADEGFAGPWGAEGGSEAGGEAGAFFGGFGGGAPSILRANRVRRNRSCRGLGRSWGGGG
jgi:hypothetical protein